MNQKKLLRIRKSPAGHWVGDGFPVRSMFSYNDGDPAISPFLLLDYAGPAEFPPTEERRGVGEHPHRGFETVTVVYQGEVEHRDSTGTSGKIVPGDVQWMTAASGIVHEEMHGRDFARNGGVLEMVQLWVNLPSEFKKSPPRYQDLRAAQIPAVALPDGAGILRVIAGDFQGHRGPARTFTPVSLWDLQLEAGKSVELKLPEGHSAFLLVRSGRVELNSQEDAGAAMLAYFDRRGETLSLSAKEESRVLLMSGEPIDEPLVGYGPFVMNREEEIDQAIEDYRRGKMGHLGPPA
ncbi:MAG TPA: pirin family protein [bacterium]|nr:pirin family protein [bacterium]